MCTLLKQNINYLIDIYEWRYIPLKLDVFVLKLHVPLCGEPIQIPFATYPKEKNKYKNCYIIEA